MNGTIGKICTNDKCSHKGVKQPYENYYKNRGYKDGYSSECRDCARIRSHANLKKKKDNTDAFNAIVFG